jgi:putative sterol carrier protein
VSTNPAASNSSAPIFILSPPRSGSTLLRYIVDTHPQVCCPSEIVLGVLCEDLHVVLSLTLGRTLPEPGSPASERIVIAEVRRIVSEIMDSYAAAKNKTRWCDKSPRNLDYLEILNEVFPDAKFICLYRHCMDVVNSFMERVQEGWMIDFKYYARNHGFRNHYSVYADSWLEKTVTMMEFERDNPDRTFGLKYEDLVQNPASTLESMFSFLGLDWDERILDSVFSTRHDPGPGDPSVAYSKKIHADSIGLGASIPRRHISNSMVERINPVLEKLGYEIVGPDWGANARRRLKERESRPRETDGEDAVVSSIDEVFQTYIPDCLRKHRQDFQGVEAVYKLILPEDDGKDLQWIVDTHELTCRPGSDDVEAQCTIVVAPDDLIDMVNGKLNSAKALRQGRLQISGDLNLANLLGQVLFTG